MKKRPERSFWDIWDIGDNNPDGYDDASTKMNWYDMAEIWTLYPDGTGAGQKSEYGTNMRDYHHNSSQISTDAYADVWRVYQSGQTYMICQPW